MTFIVNCPYETALTLLRYLGPCTLMENENSMNYLRQQRLTDEILSDAAQICWATGGRLVPDEIWNQYMNT
jgi:D-serine dehydratase